MIKLRDMKHGESTGRKQRMRVSFPNFPTTPNAPGLRPWGRRSQATSSSILQPQLSRPTAGMRCSGIILVL